MLPNIYSGTMASADFFSPLREKNSYVKFIIFPLILLHLLPRITDGFWASVSIATSPSGYPLVCSFCSLVPTFVLDFFQILSHDKHPCPQLTVLAKISPFRSLTL